MRAPRHIVRAMACISALAMLPAATAGCRPGGDSPGRAWSEPARTDALEVLPIGGDFTLTDAEGRPFSLEAHRGQAVVLFFGYASCPDFCPAAMSKVRTALNALGDQRERVLTVFISVDPQRDTPPALKAYVGNFGIRAVGLTGTDEALQGVVGKYAAFYEKEAANSAAGYLVSHTTYLYVLDPRGRVRKLVRHDDGPDVLADALRRVLTEPATAS